MATITGTNASNNLNGTNLADQIFGLGGNDTLIGFDGDDVLEGGAGADQLFGSTGFDYRELPQLGRRASQSSLRILRRGGRPRRGRPALQHRGRDRLGLHRRL